MREDGTVYVSQAQELSFLISDTLQLNDEFTDKQISADGVNGCLESLRRRQQEYPHLTLILSIGGGGFSTDIFAGIAADAGKRDHFARSARALTDEIRFNGVDSTYTLRSFPNLVGKTQRLLIVLNICRQS